jgi:hypothetical protein
MHRVSFITTEQGDDLVMAFAITTGDSSGDVVSLILLRTPKYELFLDPEERGVNVSWEKDDIEDELLLAVEMSGGVVKLKTTKRKLILDVSKVKDDDLSGMRKVLHRMNFDATMKLEGV